MLNDPLNDLFQQGYVYDFFALNSEHALSELIMKSDKEMLVLSPEPSFASSAAMVLLPFVTTAAGPLSLFTAQNAPLKYIQ